MVWEPLPAGADPLPQPTPTGPNRPQAPTSAAEAEAYLKALTPQPADYPPLLRLGPAVPTANQLGDQQGQMSAYTLSP
ncbi:hypothetical protein, partial [Vulcanococcus sp.]|uniref:hypothetical protein n=1 Tax=Vulcanococcus sp. TaxID=2856995 RepID=UPI0037DA369D